MKAKASMRAMYPSDTPEKNRPWNTRTLDADASPPARPIAAAGGREGRLYGSSTRSTMIPSTTDTSTTTAPWVLPAKNSTSPFSKPVRVPAPVRPMMALASTNQNTCSPAMNCPAPNGTPNSRFIRFPR